MKRYFVEYIDHYVHDTIRWLYVEAYSEAQVFAMLDEYKVITCDITE